MYKKKNCTKDKIVIYQLVHTLRDKYNGLVLGWLKTDCLEVIL